MPTRAWMNWSSGKDSTAALAAAREDPGLEVVGLLTTVNADADRVAMHAVRRSLLELQADRLGLPLHVVEIPSPCPNQLYEEKMAAAVAEATARDIGVFVFGDLYLEDVRAYREKALAPTSIEPFFPLWGRRTSELAVEMIARGTRAILTCVDLARLPASLAGRAFDAQLIAELPSDVDPCGERGEFHTFVWDGPGFNAPIDVENAELVTRDGFAFRDVVLATTDEASARPE